MSSEDKRYVYGANCSWHGPIQKAHTNLAGLPCCPHCSSVLFEMESKAKWDERVVAFDETHPGYKEFREWMDAKSYCFGNYRAAANAFVRETGKELTWIGLLGKS